MNKSKGRPPILRRYSIRMSKGTKFMLIQLARSTGWRQGKVLQVALQRMYEAEQDNV